MQIDLEVYQKRQNEDGTVTVIFRSKLSGALNLYERITGSLRLTIKEENDTYTVGQVIQKTL